MAFLRSASGLLLPMAAGGGSPLLNSPGNLAAPPIVRVPSQFNFDMATGSKRGWPASNNQFDNFGVGREWEFNFRDTNNSFAGIRWQPTWFAADGFYGSWEPAGGDINRIQRKGASGQDARTLVLTCVANPAAVPVGEKVVLWYSPANGDVDQTNSFNISGYNLPLRQKMTVTASRGSAQWDPNGERIIELDAGTALPAIDYTVPFWNTGGWPNKSFLQHRHWSFYKNTATKELRYPLSQFVDQTLNSVVGQDGFAMLGGVQFQPTWADWSRERMHFGGTLVDELWRLECEGLAYYLGNTDPNRLAVELENEPTREYHDVGDGPGYLDLLPDVWYGIARQVWGPERTLVVKGSDFGGLNSLMDNFDWPCPTGDNAHLVFHNYDNQIRGPGGGIYGWTDIGQTDWIADQIATKISQLGYKGGGATEIGVSSSRANDTDRGQRLGRMLTSLTARNAYMFTWSMTGDDNRCSGVENINGHAIETYYSGVRQYGRRAGIMTS